MNNGLKLVITADGSKTIWNEGIGEHYHSKHGALQESRHVFLKSGLQFYCENSTSEIVNVLEVGFGTGLNFLLSADFCLDNQIKLNYIGVEAFPLTLKQVVETAYSDYTKPEIWNAFIANYETSLNTPATLTDSVQLYIAHQPLLQFKCPQLMDVIYFDAFAAIHQPEMWTEETLHHTCQYLRSGGIFVTYAITGNLKRYMKALGFDVEKAPGAPGKREMLRAIKQ